MSGFKTIGNPNIIGSDILNNDDGSIIFENFFNRVERAMNTANIIAPSVIPLPPIIGNTPINEALII